MATDTLDTKRTRARAALDEFRSILSGFDCGEINEEDYKVARLAQGLYSQRQKGNYMLRTKIAGGLFNGIDLGKLADLSEKYSDGIVHITTRQDIQIYYIKHDQAYEALEALFGAGIISLGAGGNTLRNVNVCNHWGEQKEELFNVAPVADALSTYYLGHDYSKGLPRKVKITFCGCEKECGGALGDDIAFIATRNDSGEPGFRVAVGGGLGSIPRFAEPFVDFVSYDEANLVALALLKVFNRHGPRVNRHKARMKFLLEKIGMERLKELYAEEWEKTKAMARLDVPREALEFPRDVGNPLELRVPTGDLTAAQLRSLEKRIASESRINLWVNKSGNLQIDQVPPERVNALREDLQQQLGVAVVIPGVKSDVLSCNGAFTCVEGIANSKALAHQLEKMVDARNGAPRYRISVSGCPNACGLHHTADIGLQGSAKKAQGVLVPFYQIYLGGEATETPKTSLPIIRVPAKRIPEALRRIMEILDSEKKNNESIREAVERLGTEWFAQELETFTTLPPYADNRDSFLDWDGEKEFSIADVGPGECAGAAMEMIEGYFAQAKRDRLEAHECKNPEEILKGVKNIVEASARALLVTYGIDPENDGELFRHFRAKIIMRGFVHESYSAVFQTPEGCDLAMAEKRLELGSDFLDECLTAFKRINEPQEGEGEHTAADGSTIQRLDLTGVKCPFNYIKVKLALEPTPVGTIMEVLLDDGSPIRNVPKSLLNDGNEILSQERLGKQHLLTIKKN